jgi:hypothetical protein
VAREASNLKIANFLEIRPDQISHTVAVEKLSAEQSETPSINYLPVRVYWMGHTITGLLVCCTFRDKQVVDSIICYSAALID